MLRRSPLTEQLFRYCPDTTSMASWLMESVAMTGRMWQATRSDLEGNKDNTPETTTTVSLEGEAHAVRQEYLFTAYTHLQRLRDVVSHRRG